MDFLEHIEFQYLVITLFIAFVIGHFIIQRKDNLKLSLQFRLGFYGIVMFILIFSLPRAPWVASISTHMDLTDNENKERFLNYLQKSNDAIDRIVDIVHFMILFTLALFVSIVSSIIKHFKLEKSAE